MPAPLQNATMPGHSSWSSRARDDAAGAAAGPAGQRAARCAAAHARRAAGGAARSRSRSRRPVEMKFLTSNDASRSASVTGASSCGRKIVAAGDLDLDLVLADADPVAVRQLVQAVGAERLVIVVDEGAVRARVAQPPGAAAVLDLGVAAGHVAVRIAQHPVVAVVAADAAAVDAEGPARIARRRRPRFR